MRVAFTGNIRARAYPVYFSNFNFPCPLSCKGKGEEEKGSGYLFPFSALAKPAGFGGHAVRRKMEIKQRGGRYKINLIRDGSGITAFQYPCRELFLFSFFTYAMVYNGTACRNK